MVWMVWMAGVVWMAIARGIDGMDGMESLTVILSRDEGSRFGLEVHLTKYHKNTLTLHAVAGPVA